MSDKTKFRPYKYIKELANPERISHPAIRDQMLNSIMLGGSRSEIETLIDNNNMGFFDLWTFCINHYRYSFFETPRSELLVVPDMMSCIPPLCNVVFPDEYVHYGREVKLRGLVTRYFEQGFFTTPSLDAPEGLNTTADFAQEAYVAPATDVQPTIIDVIKGECTPWEQTLPGSDQKYIKFTQIPLPEELHYGATYMTGQGEYLSRMGEEVAKTNAGATDRSGATEVELEEEYRSFHKLNVMYKYFLTRLQSQKTTQVRLTFTPRLIPGLPVLLLSRTGRHILGLITSMSHTIDANGAAETMLSVEYQYLYDDVTKRPLYLLRSRTNDDAQSDGDPYVWKNHFMLSDDFRDYKIGKELYTTILCDSIDQKDYNEFALKNTVSLQDKSLLGANALFRSSNEQKKKEEEKKNSTKTNNVITSSEIKTKDVSVEVKESFQISCLVEGRNFIKLSTGENKLVEFIRLNDLVQVFNIQTGKIENRKIKEIKTRFVDNYYNINDSLYVTGEHPIYVKDNWKKIKDLQIGDEVKKYDSYETIFKKELINLTVKVYNFEVDGEEGTNNYFANGYLLHNKTTSVMGEPSAYLEVYRWINKNIGSYLKKFHGVIGESILAGLITREDAVYIQKNLNETPEKVNSISKATNGDGGMGLTQITSDKDFIANTDPTDWKAYINKTVSILTSDYKYFEKKFNFEDGQKGCLNATLCAYNAGRTKITKFLNKGKGANIPTTHQDYGFKVVRFAEEYKNLYGG